MQDKSELSAYTMFQGPGVQRENNIIQWIKNCPSDRCSQNLLWYPEDLKIYLMDGIIHTSNNLGPFLESTGYLTGP